MPRYYFHVRNGPSVDQDHDGMDLPDLEAAHAEALRTASELLGEVPGFGPQTMIEVTDEAGRMVLTVPFSEATGPKH